MPKLSHDAQERRRSHILDAAEACFARTGFHRTTMVDICREAKISAGALYVYFNSKEALIDGIVARDREEIAAMLTSIGEAPDFFRALEGSLRSCVLERPAHKVALFIEMAAEAHRNPHVARSIGSCESVLRAILVGLVERARASGQVSAMVDADKLVTVMLLIGDALFMRRAMNPGFDAEAVVPELMRMIRSLMIDGPALAGAETHLLDTYSMGAAQ